MHGAADERLARFVVNKQFSTSWHGRRFGRLAHELRILADV